LQEAQFRVVYRGKPIWLTAHLQLTSANHPIKVLRQRVVGCLFVNTGRGWPWLPPNVASESSGRGAGCHARVIGQQPSARLRHFECESMNEIYNKM